jgi:two-component system OmpR family response regulator
MDSHVSHILVVDDDQNVRETVQEMLEFAGYRVTTADDGGAMRAFLGKGERVDAVILDASMPGEKSDSLALRLLQLGIPILILSGGADMTNFARQNNLELLWKPFRFADLVAATARVVQTEVSDRKIAPPVWLRKS